MPLLIDHNHYPIWARLIGGYLFFLYVILSSVGPIPEAPVLGPELLFDEKRKGPLRLELETQRKLIDIACVNEDTVSKNVSPYQALNLLAS